MVINHEIVLIKAKNRKLNMQKLRVLRVVFSPEIKGFEVPAFRGAVIKKSGGDSLLFHNHIGKTGYRYSYPLIQYKRLKKKASVICIKDGVDEIHRFFENQDWSLVLNGRAVDMKIEKLEMNSFTLNVWDKFFDYRIFNWVALNNQNHKKYIETDSLTDKIQLLEKILTANILSFAKGVDWQLDKDKQVKVQIKNIINEKVTKFKKTPRVVFDVEFKTNVFIPAYIGLGKAVSHGFGVVYAVRG